MFLGLAFAASGIALLVIEIVTQCVTSQSVVPLCAGTLLGSGGIMFVWCIADHLTTNRMSPVTSK